MSSSALSNVKKTLTAPFVGAFQVMIEWRVWWPFLIESKHFTDIEYTRKPNLFFIKNIADACRPAPDRALRQGRIESCTYRPAAWFVFEFYHVTGRCFIHSDGQVSWTREPRLSASSALRSSPLAFLLSGLLTTRQHSSGLIICCLDSNNLLYIEQPRPGRWGLWHCCSNDQH